MLKNKKILIFLELILFINFIKAGFNKVGSKNIKYTEFSSYENVSYKDINNKFFDWLDKQFLAKESADFKENDTNLEWIIDAINEQLAENVATMVPTFLDTTKCYDQSISKIKYDALYIYFFEKLLTKDKEDNLIKKLYSLKGEAGQFVFLKFVKFLQFYIVIQINNSRFDNIVKKIKSKKLLCLIFSLLRTTQDLTNLIDWKKIRNNSFVKDFCFLDKNYYSKLKDLNSTNLQREALEKTIKFDENLFNSKKILINNLKEDSVFSLIKPEKTVINAIIVLGLICREMQTIVSLIFKNEKIDQTLDIKISNQKLTEVPDVIFTFLDTCKTLDLSDNNIKFFDYKTLDLLSRLNLEKLVLTGNPICQNRFEIIKLGTRLPSDCELVYE